MNAFFWSAGRLGWGLFALLLFSGLWVLLTDLLWRVKNVAIQHLLAAMAVGWVVGATLIVLACCAT